LPFLPSPSIPGFTYINPGITLNSTLTGSTFNSNVAGNLTGNVVGSVNGNVVGNVTGNIVGNVTGNIVGNVTATTLTGTLTGDVVSTNGRIANLTSGNANITGGTVTGLSNLTTSNTTSTNLVATNSNLTNLSVANLLVAGGTLAGLTSLVVTNLTSTNFITANAQISSGNATGLTNTSATTATFTNFSAANVLIAGGSLSGIGGFTAYATQTTNFATGNALITGGSATGLTTVTAASGQVTNLSTANIIVSSGNVSNTVGVNNTLTNANLINATATTKSYNDNSTSVATTAYVNSVLPRGAIIMWGGIIASIPTGWQLCDGSNGTPNLLDRFVIGAGLSYPAGNIAGASIGGTNSVTLTNSNLPTHTHSVALSATTDASGAHNHTIIDPGHQHYSFGDGAPNGGGAGSALTSSSRTPLPVQSATTGVSLTQAASHVHTFNVSGNVNSAGSGQSFSILPTYYALCYIQKMY
jgi:hypothetical protein